MKSLIKKFIPDFLLNRYHFLLAFLGAVIYRFPSRKLKVIGVTGTKGKSTTVILAGKILEEAGFKVGWITSATFKIGEKEWFNPYHQTMPGRFFIQKFLREAVKGGCQYCLIEVTSEGILQHRHKFIKFDAAVFTNLAPEHIEAHKGFENYRRTKANLFQAVKKIHILNLDDENAEYFLRFPADEKLAFKISGDPISRRSLSCRDGISMIEAYSCQETPGGIHFSVKNINFNLKLLGRFNIYNVLAAIGIALSRGVSLEVCKSALEKIKGIPGRLEIVSEGQPFVVIVDLAHTPDSFEKVFKLAKGLPHKKIISVFGSAGGGRDKWKRPELGKIASRYSDYIILTNEDPYDENPSQILSEIKSGISNFQFPTSNLYEILDRRQAIKKALSLSKAGDIVLFLGKGTEQTMVVGPKKIPWDERQIVREELNKL